MNGSSSSNSAEVLIFLLLSLEATVSDLGAGINKFEGDLLKSGSGDSGNDGLSDETDSLLRSNATTLDHDEVVINHTIMGEATDRGDGLLSQIREGGGGVLISSLTNSVDLLIELSSMMETLVTGPGDSPPDSSGMPRSNATNSPVTSMGLLGEMLNTVSLDDTGSSMTLGDTADIDHLILVDDSIDGDLLLEESSGEVNLLGDIASINLNFENVVLLLPKVELVHLGGGDDSNDGSILPDTVKFHFDRLVGLIFMLLGVLAEGLLLGLHPVLVEPSEGTLIELLAPDSGHGPKTTGGVNITNNTHNSHGGSLNDRYSLDHLLFIVPGTLTVNLSQDVGHASLESGESSKMTAFSLVILREVPDSTSESLRPPSGGKAKMAMSGSFKFPV